ncbi:hypothetical protein [Marinomonas mediterranea]|uniref:hypothetical protein n=1 Tax=Marinomonas mediterranea TaxID=119864 RepID=UPI00234BA0B0|nr:hypothetical protein [Marinomonas mediterranea]WCN09619.1 hypothetical protein GV055_12160 [Marinomonas mediterranea]
MNLNNDYFIAKPKSNAHASDIELDFFNAQLEAHLLFAKWIKAGAYGIGRALVKAVKLPFPLKSIQLAKS